MSQSLRGRLTIVRMGYGGTTTPTGGMGTRTRTGQSTIRRVSRAQAALTADDGHIRRRSASGSVTYVILQSDRSIRSIACVKECKGQTREGHNIHACGIDQALAIRLDHPVCTPQPQWKDYRADPRVLRRIQHDERLRRNGCFVPVDPEDESWYVAEVAGAPEGYGWGGAREVVFWDETILPPDYGYEDYYANAAAEEQRRQPSGSKSKETERAQPGERDGDGKGSDGDGGARTGDQQVAAPSLSASGRPAQRVRKVKASGKRKSNASQLDVGSVEGEGSASGRPMKCRRSSRKGSSKK